MAAVVPYVASECVVVCRPRCAYIRKLSTDLPISVLWSRTGSVPIQPQWPSTSSAIAPWDILLRDLLCVITGQQVDASVEVLGPPRPGKSMRTRKMSWKPQGGTHLAPTRSAEVESSADGCPACRPPKHHHHSSHEKTNKTANYSTLPPRDL